MRTWLAGALLALGMTSVPVTAEGPVDLEEACEQSSIANCGAFAGCKSSSFSGVGGLNEYGDLHSAAGSWVDGCGGRHRDDNVAGEYGISGSFHVNELPDGEGNAAHCSSRPQHHGDQGSVNPGWTDDNQPFVSFSCLDSNGDVMFSGYLGPSSPGP